MFSEISPVVLIGCGKMGCALLEGWLRAGIAPEAIVVVDHHVENMAHFSKINRFFSVDSLHVSLKPQAVVLCVKPASFGNLAETCHFLVTPNTVFLSVMAGKTISTLEMALGRGARIVRSMTNLPACIGRGMTVLCPGQNVSHEQRNVCSLLAQGVGAVRWIENEALLDIVTAISGSGPAYIFRLVDTLAHIGQQLGLPEELASTLAQQTVCGASELLQQSSLSPLALSQAVTSPGGTTEAALEVFIPGLKELIEKTLSAAIQRSRSLNETNSI